MTARARQEPAELEIDADAGFERAQWKVPQMAWALLALVPVAAMLGAFGGGRSSRRAVELPGALLQHDAARQSRGLERMSQIRFAILERTGGISIIPRSPTHDTLQAEAPAQPDIT